jgi:Uma2 family endonuclease
MSTLPRPLISPEEYLEIERKAEFKSEYYNGEMFAMSGGSRYHERISMQLTGLVWRHLQNTRCEAYTANMRVRTPGGLYTYPDLSITCAEAQFYDKELDTLLNPTLLVEILSPSTEAYDRGRKAELYRAIPSLRELLIVAQDRLHVELFRRAEGGPWDFSEADGLEGSIELTSISLTLRLSELYQTAIARDDKGLFKTAAG